MNMGCTSSGSLLVQYCPFHAVQVSGQTLVRVQDELEQWSHHSRPS